MNRFSVGRLASATALIGAVLGIPWLLVKMTGSPFAHWATASSAPAARSRIPDVAVDPAAVAHWVGRIAVLLAWASWLWLVVCVAFEIHTVVSRRPHRALPASRTMQSLVACLVGTVLAMTPGHRSPSATSKSRPAAAWTPASGNGWTGHQPSVRVIDDLAAYRSLADAWPDARELPWPDRRVAAGAPRRGEPPTPGSPEAATSSSRPLASGGPRTTRTAPRRSTDGLASGPPVAAGRATTTAPRAARQDTGPRRHVVGSRETLWSIAQDELGAATRWREIADLNYGLRQADGGSLDHRHWVAPGWTLLIPTGGAKGDERVHPGARPPRSVPTAPIAPTAPLAPFGAGVVGNGVAAFLDRMRRVQQRYRREGELIALPDGPNTIEQRLRMGDGRRILEDCDAAVRDVITRLVARDGPVPAPSPIAGVRVSTDVVEVLLGSPSDATGGHEAAGLPGVRETVVLDRSRLRRAGQQGGPVTGPPLIPLLVSVGRTTDTTAFVNLEWLGSLAVDGDGSAEEFFRAVCLELATSAGPRSFDLRLVGLDRELGRFDRVQTVDPGDRFALDELAGAVRDRVAQVRTDPAVTGSRRLAEASLRASASALRRPLVVACGPAVPRDLAAEIGDAAGDDSGAVVALALGCMPGSRHTLWIAGDGEDASTEILGSWLTPQRVDRAELQQVDDLLERAAERRSVSAKAAAAASHDARQFDQTSDGIRTEIEVCVLGPIEIHGALRPFTRAWAEELVVYLSMHPNGVANEVWATALWPDRLMAPSSLHSTASVARRALGRSRNGDDHLPRSHGRLRLGPTVGTDWRRFVAICEAGTPTAWRTALELVRGQPFTGLRASDWPVLEGIAPAIEATVVDVSGRLSGACLQIGDAAGAEWAARRGLMVSPYDERLYRMLLRSADAAGNPAGVESAMEELIQLVADDIEPLDSVHPSTLDLYRSLTRRRTAVQAPVRTPRAARARLTPEARVQIDRRRLTTRTRVEDRNDD